MVVGEETVLVFDSVRVRVNGVNFEKGQIILSVPTLNPFLGVGSGTASNDYGVVQITKDGQIVSDETVEVSIEMGLANARGGDASMVSWDNTFYSVWKKEHHEDTATGKALHVRG